MPHRMRSSDLSDPVRSLENIGSASDRIGPRPAKAHLDASLSYVAVMTDAILNHFGSVKEAAFALDKVDPSQMMREFKGGNFRLFDKAEEADKTAVLAAVHKIFGPTVTPGSELKHLMERRRQIEERIEEILDEVFLSERRTG